MKRIIIPALILLACALPVAGQYGRFGNHGYRDAENTVAQWYQQFLRRQADPHAGGWVQALQSGQEPEQVLAGILGSREYYVRAGGSPTAFVQSLYEDLTGRPPSQQELRHWTSQSYNRSREDVAYAILTRGAQNWDRGWDRGQDWRDQYDYRRPTYRFR